MEIIILFVCVVIIFVTLGILLTTGNKTVTIIYFCTSVVIGAFCFMAAVEIYQPYKIIVIKELHPIMEMNGKRTYYVEGEYIEVPCKFKTVNQEL